MHNIISLRQCFSYLFLLLSPSLSVDLTACNSPASSGHVIRERFSSLCPFDSVTSPRAVVYPRSLFYHFVIA